MDFRDLIQRRFPQNDQRGFYRLPDIPNGAMSRALNDFTRLSQRDVVAIYRYGSLMGGSGSVVLTATHLHHPKGSFALADLKGAFQQGKDVQFQLNTGGGSIGTVNFKCATEEDAQALQRFLDDVATAPRADDIAPTPQADYSAYSPEAVNWLELRDEVMRTIDQLHERFQDGRLSLMEYEDKKADLLSRL